MFQIYVKHNVYSSSLNAPKNGVLRHAGEPLCFGSREEAKQYVAEFCMRRELRHNEYAPPQYTVRRESVQ